MGKLVDAVKNIEVTESRRHLGQDIPTSALRAKQFAESLASEVEQRMASAGVVMPGEDGPEEEVEAPEGFVEDTNEGDGGNTADPGAGLTV